MAQPTQQLPPWLTPSVVVVTDAAGAPVATNTDIVYVPPTYFGPSIPLGSLYIFGGTTEPATIVLPSAQSTTTVAPPATTTATPPTTTPPTTIATPVTSVPISITTSAAITSTTPPTTTPTTSATPTTSIIPVTSSFASSSASSTISSTISLSTTSIASTTSASFTATSASTSFSVIQPHTTTVSGLPTSTGPSTIGGLTKGQLVGVIVASILGLIFLFVLALFLFLWCKGRRNRRNFATLSPGLDDDYYFVPAGVRVPGEGSPRHSGEEADPFLQQSSGAGWAGAETSAAGGTATSRGSYRNSPLANVATLTEPGNGATAPQVPGNQATSRLSAVTRVPPPTVGSNSSGSASSGSHASGFGVLLDRPAVSGIAYHPITYDHQAESGRPLSQADMERIDDEHVLPHEGDQHGEGEYTGAYAYSRDSVPAPPRLVIPGTAPLLPSGDPEHLPFSGSDPYLSHPASLQDLQEASLLTATRVRAQDLAPRSSPTSSQAAAPSHRSSSGGLLGALGLGGLSSIGRMSWFKNLDSPKRSMSDASYSAAPLSEKDLETGRSMLSPQTQADSLGNRPRGTGLSPEGLRPVSNVSGRSAASGNSMYHDAQSTLPGTPVLATLPRAVTPGDATNMPINEHTWFSSPLSNTTAGPPPYNTSTPSPYSLTAANFDQTPDADILDMPAPTALNHFASISSLKETNTGSSVGIKAVPFPPPGLNTVRPIGWAAGPLWDGTSLPSPSPSMGSFGVHNIGMGMNLNTDLGVGHGTDVLEEEPPDAEQGWRTISSTGSGAAFMDNGRRGTFGRFVHNSGFASEQGSLHSMRSHFTPASIRSTGSAAASRRDMSVHSTSSGRPSMGSSGAFSAAAHSLARTGSLSSDQRRRLQTSSPALSAFDGHQVRAAGSSGSGYVPGEPSFSPVISSPLSAHMGGSEKAHTVRTMGSDAMSLMMDTSFATGSTVHPARSLSPLGANFPLNAPWAGGLDSDWQPAV